jgi:hypothetical protein
MSKRFLAIVAFTALFCGISASAQPAGEKSVPGTMAMPGGSHEGMSHAPDNRQALDFPPMMQDHMKSMMRAHLATLGEIMAALAKDDAAKAATLAETRIGLSAPGSAACVKGEKAEGMAAMMARHMPEEMRMLGMTMHAAASDFAVEAAKVKAGGDARPALAALAKVTEGCAACHAAYRFR